MAGKAAPMKLLTAFFTIAAAASLYVLAVAASRLDARLAWPAAIVAAGSFLGLWGFPT